VGILLLILCENLVTLDKLLYYRNIILENLTRCEKVLQIGSKCSAFKLQARKNFTDRETTRLGNTENRLILY